MPFRVLLQFGHGYDAVETLTAWLGNTLFALLQFGHGYDAVETNGTGEARAGTPAASIRPRL